MSAALLFDLDGCLVDSLPVIRRCWQQTLPRFGLPAPSASLTREIAGPPVEEVARRLLPGASPERIAEILAVYRACSRAGARDVLAFPGVAAMLAQLRARSVRLGVATSRARDIAVPMLEGLGLREHFAVIEAPGVDELGIDKATVVARALAGLAPDVPLGLVGDRSHDVVGAHAHGLRAFGALWGYGGRDELTAAGADALLAAPVDVLSLVEAPAR